MTVGEFMGSLIGAAVSGVLFFLLWMLWRWTGGRLLRPLEQWLARRREANAKRRRDAEIAEQREAERRL